MALISEAKMKDARPPFARATLSVIERLDPDVIASQRKRPLFFVPDGKGKHAVETRQDICAPLGKAVEQDFGVGLGVKLVALAFEFLAQLAVVVDLAVEGDD